MTRMRTVTLALSVSAVTVLIVLAGCRRKTAETAALDSFPVKVEAASRRDLEQSLSLVGSLKAKDEATLFSRVPGKLIKNLLEEGEAVRKGQGVALVERDEVGVKFEPAPVPSTLDGIVGRLYLDKGANVALNTPIALVVDQSQVVARAEVPERYVAHAAVGKSVDVRVEAYPGRVFKGRISRVAPVMDPSTRSTPIEVLLENPGGTLKSGMFAQLALSTARKAGALAVPVDAVTDGSGPAVFVEKDGKAAKREVVLGVRTDTHVEILSGLAEGERVITFGLYGLKDGSPVQVLAPEAAK